VETGSIIVPKPRKKKFPKSSNESVAAGRRRRFSAAYKVRIVSEADACTEAGEVAALLRREGLYSSHLSNWRREMRREALAGMNAKKRGRKPKKTSEQRRIEELEKRNAALEKELHIANALLDLQRIGRTKAPLVRRAWSPRGNR